MPLRTPRRLAAALALTAAAALPAAAQAWFIPSFQPPRVTDRDYTIAVAANAGTSALFQWREATSGRNGQFSLEAGLVDADPSQAKLLLGAGYAHQLARATSQQPLDLLLTAGLGLAAGEGVDVLRVPIGVSVGHRFQLDGPLAITPYVHPRLSLDTYFGRRDDDLDLAIDFDVGASFEVTSQLAIRGSLVLSGSGGDDVGFGLGLTIRPQGLARVQRGPAGIGRGRAGR